MALLEALVGLAILGSAGTALTAVVHQAIRAETASARVERQLDEADRVLAAHTLLLPRELDQRIGVHAVGEFDVSVQRPERGLYRIAIAADEAPERTLLVTVVYKRPESR